MKRFGLLAVVAALAGVWLMPLGVGAESTTMDHAHHGAGHSKLQEPGQDAFGTIQEVIARLNADPNTDWPRVNLEALRRHLVDMNEFTLNVRQVKSKPIPKGVELVIEPETRRAKAALARALSAHPAMVRQEAGWDMKVEPEGRGYRLRVTDPTGKAADKIRGLGYIGVMALGNHHQHHHWLMATGVNPH